jgi:hypothetical protein
MHSRTVDEACGGEGGQPSSSSHISVDGILVSGSRVHERELYLERRRARLFVRVVPPRARPLPPTITQSWLGGSHARARAAAVQHVFCTAIRWCASWPGCPSPDRWLFAFLGCMKLSSSGHRGTRRGDDTLWCAPSTPVSRLCSLLSLPSATRRSGLSSLKLWRFNAHSDPSSVLQLPTLPHLTV